MLLGEWTYFELHPQTFRTLPIYLLALFSLRDYGSIRAMLAIKGGLFLALGAFTVFYLATWSLAARQNPV